MNCLDSEVRSQYMEQYDQELETLCKTMNPAYADFTACKQRYSEIMDYFRVQLHRGYITKEQYHERARKFVGYTERAK